MSRFNNIMSGLFGLPSYKLPEVKMEADSKQEVEASYNGFGAMPGEETAVGSFGFDGEKVPGEIGTIKRYFPSYRRLSLRGWQSFLDSDVAQAVIRKYVRWVIGAGLKLQAEPIMEILEGSGVDFDRANFVKQSELRFALWSKSKRSTHDKQMSFNSLLAEIKKHALVGGDCLVYLRTDENANVTVQLIDGMKVSTPMMSSSDTLRSDNEGGRMVKYGIAFDEEGQHMAYYVQQKNLEHIRIPARDENGMLVAFMCYGLRYRIDNCRGIPLHTAILQTISQLDRYKEAAVGSAEERAKIVYSVEHDMEGTGENIHQRNIKSAIQQGLNKTLDRTTQYWDDNYNNLIAQTTNKQVPNLPPGAKLHALATQNELNFQPFMMGNLTILCATLEMPVEVALSKYDSNFSASRAALKDWEHTINVARAEVSEDVATPTYQFWLTMQVMSRKIQAAPLIQAFSRGDIELFEAITHARFIGAQVPHIDPVKEVQAERLKLGDQGKAIPLTTASQATEALGTGDYSENAERFQEEVEDFKPEPPQIPGDPSEGQPGTDPSEEGEEDIDE